MSRSGPRISESIISEAIGCSRRPEGRGGAHRPSASSSGPSSPAGRSESESSHPRDLSRSRRGAAVSASDSCEYQIDLSPESLAKSLVTRVVSDWSPATRHSQCLSYLMMQVDSSTEASPPTTRATEPVRIRLAGARRLGHATETMSEAQHRRSRARARARVVIRSAMARSSSRPPPLRPQPGHPRAMRGEGLPPSGRQTGRRRVADSHAPCARACRPRAARTGRSQCGATRRVRARPARGLAGRTRKIPARPGLTNSEPERHCGYVRVHCGNVRV